ncbi:hypothetical protein Pan241w_22790 [Gimesia alba]|uniref:HEAT repeat protein n=1 Tax=Gimesia alba TaxID=2527973 RepID=A0A517RE99_9PLAN|nr:hypothetical protein [Gimesia alba]QDT42198.1 hypothetical protein Pan241w_22790 [Gimesia alba]
MKIQQEIANWDGKSVEALQAIYDCHGLERGFGAALIPLLKEPGLERGASWLLKLYLEEGGVLSPTEVKQVFQSLSEVKEWETALHLLQSLPYLTIGKRDVKQVEAFLRRCLTSENKFVRAWAYNGFYELALQHPQFKAETDQLLEQAIEDEAASVKARVRNILKQRL